ncbi:MAG: hypothetical protein CMJ78_03095 [Planctomycetaceae bacterium]|nr:hypothetical protein [Planctomycetaceae bacterium]
MRQIPPARKTNCYVFEDGPRNQSPKHESYALGKVITSCELSDTTGLLGDLADEPAVTTT